mgnify:CR=1 FL=1
MKVSIVSFSALQRAEIAEIRPRGSDKPASASVSVLFNEPKLLKSAIFADFFVCTVRFSALQRAEIAEIDRVQLEHIEIHRVSVLFNEPKLLKSTLLTALKLRIEEFQCSSTSRNC